MPEQLWVDGRPAALQTSYDAGEITPSYDADGGCKELSWKMDFPARYTHPSFVRGKVAELRLGGMPTWAGLLTEPNFDDDWTFTAVGFSTLAANGFLAFDSSLNVSFTPDVAIDRAISKGIGWKRPASLSAAAYKPSTDTDDLIYLGALLDGWSTANGKRWGVNEFRQVYAAADPTSPSWYLVPGAGRFGLADDDYAATVYLRYLDSATGVYKTTLVEDAGALDRFGPREYGVDATSLGATTAASTKTIGNGLMAKGKARLGFTNGLEATPYQLLTPGGRPAPLELVRGQQMVRQFGVLDERGQPMSYVDWVIGQVSREVGSKVIGLTPVQPVARDLSTVLSLIADS